jgi:hypothetical protein
MGQLIQFPKITREVEVKAMSEERATIRYVRNDKGDFVKSAVKVAQKSYEIVSDVARVYADLLNGLLKFSIKIGLFVLLFPYISDFVKAFIELVQGL